MNHKHLTYYVVALTVLLLLSCKKSELQPISPSEPSGKTVSVRIELNIPSATAVRGGAITRAKDADGGFEVIYDDETTKIQTRSDGTTELHNLWIFQFNADGSINGRPQKISDGVTPINDMVILDVPLKVAENQTLYILALGPKIEEDLSAVTSLTELKAWEFGYTTSVGGGYKSKINSDTEIPLGGSVSGVKVVEIEGGKRGLIEYNTPSGFGGNIPIYRLMSVITLRYEFDVTGYRYGGILLVNAAGLIRLTNPDKNPINDQYITLEPNYVDSIPNGMRTATWYVPQNKQGTVETIQTENARYYKVVNNVASGSAPAKGCNIEVWSHSKSKPDEFAIYQIYVGLNNTSNFDVLANNAYNLRTTINSEVNSAQKDERIRAFKASQSIYFCSSQIISYGSFSSPPAGVRYDLDSHFDRRPIVVQTIGTSVDVGIYTDQQCTILADPTTSWLKISSSSNYTDAYNNRVEPLGTIVGANTFLPTQLKFYLYNDEYIFDSNGQILAEKSKRRLYIKATTKTVGSDGQVIVRTAGIFAIDQHGATYYGNYAGKNVNGVADGLFVDDVIESYSQYDREPVNTSQTINFGFTSLIDATGYPASVYDGKANTRWLAEATHIKVNQGKEAAFDNPRRLANGKIDINQYTYYNTYAARYCYDRNRDENGNGEIDDNELKWYLPSSTELLGYFATMDEARQFSSNSCFSSFARFSSVQYSIYNMYGNDGKFAEIYDRTSTARCVRSVAKDEIPVAVAASPVAYAYTSASGAKYAAINASALPRKSIARSLDTAFYKNDILLFGYTSNGQNAPPILDENGVQVKTRRVKRYKITNGPAKTYSPNLNCSSNFIISPRDVSPRGRDTPVVGESMTMNWATANGYLATANTVDIAIDASATDRGCAYYLGVDGTDNIGDWRIPTQREWAVILAMESALIETSGVTDFKQLADGRSYWTSAENWASEQRAWVSTSLNSTRFVGAFLNPDQTKSFTHNLRCIKDLE